MAVVSGPLLKRGNMRPVALATPPHATLGSAAAAAADTVLCRVLRYIGVEIKTDDLEALHALSECTEPLSAIADAHGAETHTRGAYAVSRATTACDEPSEKGHEVREFVSKAWTKALPSSIACDDSGRARSLLEPEEKAEEGGDANVDVDADAVILPGTYLLRIGSSLLSHL